MNNAESKSLTPTSAAPASAAARWGAAVLPVLAFALLTALAAQVRVGGPVPTTLQTVAVLLAGFYLRPPAAAAAMVVYLFVGGALHWPVFALDGGLTGHTGGFLLGFVPAAWTVSRLRGDHDASWRRLVFAGLVGTAVVFACGVPWLALMLGDWSAAVAAGLVPFLLPGLVKLSLAVAVVTCGRSLMRKRE